MCALVCGFSDELKGFFSKYGKVVEHEIIRDHTTKRSRGFGFIVFDNEKVVDTILTDGNMIDMAGTQVCSVCAFSVCNMVEASHTNYHEVVTNFNVKGCVMSRKLKVGASGCFSII